MFGVREGGSEGHSSAETACVFVALDARRLLTGMGEHLVFGGARTEVHREGGPELPSSEVVSDRTGPVSVLGDTDQVHALIECVELLDGLAQILDILSKGGELLANVDQPVVKGGLASGGRASGGRAGGGAITRQHAYLAGGCRRGGPVDALPRLAPTLAGTRARGRRRSRCLIPAPPPYGAGGG